MKKKLFFLFLASTFFISCKKDNKNNNTPPPTGKLYKVSFNLSGFNQTIQKSGSIKKTDGIKTDDLSTDTSSTDTLTVLDYQVYNSSGLAVHKLVSEQEASGAFSSITDNLPAGTYTVVLVAGKTGLTYNTAANSPMASDYFNYYNTYIWDDTFYSKFPITVSANDTTVNATLSRIVSQLEVNIEDALPAHLKSVGLNITNFVNEVNIASGNVVSSGPVGEISQAVPAAAIGTTNFKFYNIVVAGPTAMTVEIMAHDSSDNLLGDVTVNNVICQANKRTILTGKLFGLGGSNTFGLVLNNQWDPTPYITVGF